MGESDLLRGWAVETLHGNYLQGLRIDRMLYDSETALQRIRIFENATFGHVLTLDNIVQTTTGDEFIYHEMLAHVPLLAHGAARRVLIIGGGDGGMAREVLRHASVEQVTMVEIDRMVIELSQKFLPTLSAGAFDDPRLDLVIADGAKFVTETNQRFDVVIIDSTDPVGAGEALFTETFYAATKRCLTAGGVLVTQNGVPFLQGAELTTTMRTFRALFSDATCYLATVPSYSGGPMAFGWGTDGEVGQTSLETLKARYKAAGLSTRYYTPEVHLAAFALPGYVSDL